MRARAGVAAKRRWIVAAVATALWCAVSGHVAFAADGDLPAIVLLREAPEGVATRWRVIYRLPWPVEELRFERVFPGLRRGWSAATPGYELEADSAGERVRLRRGEVPSDTVELLLPEDATPLAGEYEPMLSFGDGAVAIFTGHLRAAARAAGLPERGVPVRSFRLVPWPGGEVLVGGSVHDTPVRFEDVAGAGTYALFGGAPHALSSVGYEVLDRDLPRWVDARTREVLPRLLELYLVRLGVELRQRPLVLFTWAGSSGRGMTSHGGVLPGQVQLTVEGPGWLAETDEGRGLLDHLLAHELVHLWTSDRVLADGSAMEWLTEGGADALAERALLELGMLDPDRRAALLSDALFDCRLRVRGPAARGDRWAARSEYSCGNVIGAWSEHALSGRSDLIGLWRQVVAGALANGDRYDEASYLRALAELGAPPATVDAISRFVRDPAGQVEDAWTSLAGSGLRWQVQAPPRAARVELGQLALGAVMAADCGGSVSFSRRGDYYLTDALASCAAFATERRVVALGGHELREAGELAYDYVARQCSAGGRVVVTPAAPDAPFESGCERPLVERPPYSRIEPW
jgi:hypothetical protein